MASPKIQMSGLALSPAEDGVRALWSVGTRHFTDLYQPQQGRAPKSGTPQGGSHCVDLATRNARLNLLPKLETSSARSYWAQGTLRLPLGLAEGVAKPKLRTRIRKKLQACLRRQVVKDGILSEGRLKLGRAEIAGVNASVGQGAAQALCTLQDPEA